MSYYRFITASRQHRGDYAELCSRRRHIESDIAHQEVRIAEALSRLISPRHVRSVLSGIAVDSFRSGFSLFRWINRGWQWLQFARRFVKRFM
ncbi:MAG: hypothetical protein IIV86_06405 [Bacteroidaceae bacterium]|nr:hypothetical protein [Bacteroidaceae bacterium]